jgi:hypothetical protein
MAQVIGWNSKLCKKSIFQTQCSCCYRQNIMFLKKNILKNVMINECCSILIGPIFDGDSEYPIKNCQQSVFIELWHDEILKFCKNPWNLVFDSTFLMNVKTMNENHSSQLCSPWNALSNAIKFAFLWSIVIEILTFKVRHSMSLKLTLNIFITFYVTHGYSTSKYNN